MKKTIERSIGERFIHWYNNNRGTRYTFKSMGADPPDLVYANGADEFFIEVTTSYYDPNDARIQKGGYRKNPDAPTRWSGMNIDESLFADVANRIARKCTGSHQKGTVLVVFISPALTTIRDVEMQIEGIAIPTAVPFQAIYLCGIFAVSSDSPIGGFQCWALYNEYQGVVADGSRLHFGPTVTW